MNIGKTLKISVWRFKCTCTGFFQYFFVPIADKFWGRMGWRKLSRNSAAQKRVINLCCKTYQKEHIVSTLFVPRKCLMRSWTISQAFRQVTKKIPDRKLGSTLHSDIHKTARISSTQRPLFSAKLYAVKYFTWDIKWAIHFFEQQNSLRLGIAHLYKVNLYLWVLMPQENFNDVNGYKQFNFTYIFGSM